MKKAALFLALLLILLPLTAPAEAPSHEAAHALMEGMFLAAAGVDEKSELALWKTLTAAEQAARSAENAAYRAKTLPWLQAVFAPEAALPAQSLAAFQSNEHGRAYLELLTQLGASDGPGCLAVMRSAAQVWLGEIDHDKLAGINGHYQLWLYAPATPIDYPVVQCGSNSRYLDRLFSGEKNPAGTIFIDSRNLPGFADPNTLIYGHHMRDGSMFKALTDYDAPGYFDAHPWMLAIGPEAIRLIEVFAGYVTDGGDHCYDIAISGAQDMARFAQTAEKKSDFASHVAIDSGADHLVTLSTCAYNYDNARYIVIGRLVLLWEE